ncbi:MAG: isoprenyl transferase [Chloroflexota bacterium]
MAIESRTLGVPVAAPAAIPRHIAIIMDGNGRWARSRDLERLAGHRAGTENIRRIIRACVEQGVPYLTLYAFSTENWRRPPSEVSGLMDILADVIDRELMELHEEGVQLRHIGRLEALPPTLRDKVLSAVALTAGNNRLTLNLAFNYGGRDEIVRAAQQLIRDGLAPEDVDEAAISARLYTHGQPDPDLIIRTAGEMRLSNFLLWQAAYAEYWSTPTFWPDFDREHLLSAIEDFGRRQRRFGSV